MRRIIATVSAGGFTAALLAAAATAAALPAAKRPPRPQTTPGGTALPNKKQPPQPQPQTTPGGGKVTICHRTGSLTNPFVELKVSRRALETHVARGDFVAPDSGCPEGTAAAPAVLFKLRTSNGGLFSGTFVVQQFSVQNGKLAVTANVAGTFFRHGHVKSTITQVTLPVSSAVARLTKRDVCGVLRLRLGSFDLPVAGTSPTSTGGGQRVSVPSLALDVVATSGPARLVGNLLCSLAGVINGGSVAEAAADTLDRLVSRLGPVTVTGSATNGETFKGTFRVAGFGAPGRTAHALVVVGQLEGSITDKSNKTTQIRDNRVALPATPVSTSTGCGTLRFQVGPADVNLAGNTTVRLAAATLELSDQTTFLSVPPGLLCTIAGLLTASDPLSGVAAVLNQLLVTKA